MASEFCGMSEMVRAFGCCWCRVRDGVIPSPCNRNPVSLGGYDLILRLNIMHLSSGIYKAMASQVMPGGIHDDSTCFQMSKTFATMAAPHRLHIVGPFLIGDSAHPLNQWLLIALTQMGPGLTGCASTAEKPVFNLEATSERLQANHINARIRSRFESWTSAGRFCRVRWNLGLCAARRRRASQLGPAMASCDSGPVSLPSRR